MSAPEVPGSSTPTSTWVERGLALTLTVCFVVALVLRILEPPAQARTVQFALLAVGVVAALALVAVRPRQQHPTGAGTGWEAGSDGHMSR